jgi:hypothetical protein
LLREFSEEADVTRAVRLKARVDSGNLN